jgi:hypothetical protein
MSAQFKSTQFIPFLIESDLGGLLLI